jgi:hypothetical protein
VFAAVATIKTSLRRLREWKEESTFVGCKIAAYRGTNTPKRPWRDPKMPENEVLANQKQILRNQKSILANQDDIKANQGIIKKNQASILKNQATLNTIVKNQKKILAKLS